MLEDLLLLGALEDKVVFGSMNRGGLPGASFELDDRFTAYDADAIARCGFDGGKMLLRIDLGDPATARTLEACARAVDALAARRLIAMVEPFVAAGVDGGSATTCRTDAVIRVGRRSPPALGSTSAYTWLKLPVVADMERVMAATTLPTLLLGGDPDERARGDLRDLGEGARAARRARPGRRPGPALPARRRRRRRGGHRRRAGDGRRRRGTTGT